MRCSASLNHIRPAAHCRRYTIQTMTNERDILTFLKKIEAGDINLLPRTEPQEVYAGVVEYDAANRWSIAIFNDANEWDYIEWIKTSKGEFIQFDDLENIPALRDYEPSTDVAWTRYGIPGYMKYRCKVCNKVVKRLASPFVCNECSR